MSASLVVVTKSRRVVDVVFDPAHPGFHVVLVSGDAGPKDGDALSVSEGINRP